MLRFQLFGFPVRVEWMFWLVCLLLGIGLLEGDGPEPLLYFAIWTLVVFVSIIWHELGHAFARRKFGAPHSEIILYGFGGLCGGPGRFTRGQSIMISAAGPLAGFLLGAVIFPLVLTPGMDSKWVKFFVLQMIWVNIGWSLFNLLPVIPLDGGRILEHSLGERRIRTTYWTGLVVAAVVAVFSLLGGQIYIAILFGMLAYSNWQRLNYQKPMFG